MNDVLLLADDIYIVLLADDSVLHTVACFAAQIKQALHNSTSGPATPTYYQRAAHTEHA